LFYHNEAVQQFQLIQESLNHLILKIVFAAELKKSEIDAQQQRLISGIREVLGATVKVEVQECERIEPSASGKYLFTLSKIIH